MPFKHNNKTAKINTKTLHLNSILCLKTDVMNSMHSVLLKERGRVLLSTTRQNKRQKTITTTARRVARKANQPIEAGDPGRYKRESSVVFQLTKTF